MNNHSSLEQAIALSLSHLLGGEEHTISMLLREKAQTLLTHQGVPEEQAYYFLTAIDEAYQNAAEANKQQGGPRKPTSIWVYITPTTITFAISNKGAFTPPRTRQNPLTRNKRGRGLTLIQSFTHNVYYQVYRRETTAYTECYLVLHKEEPLPALNKTA